LSEQSNVITITEVPAPEWGKTSHNATLKCPHGRTVYTVFGDAAERREKALAMAPAHRSVRKCGCEPADLVPA
jgi:hypothetical protein